MIFFVTICHPATYEKPQKMAFFRPSDPFVTNTPCFLGPKFDYYLTKFDGAIIQFGGSLE